MVVLPRQDLWQRLEGPWKSMAIHGSSNMAAVAVLTGGVMSAV